MDAVNVLISGDNVDTVELVSSVVSSTLSEKGFSNVTFISADTGEPSVGPAEDTPTLLDLCRKGNPEIFATPIQIAMTSDAVTDVEPIESSEEEESIDVPV